MRHLLLQRFVPKTKDELNFIKMNLKALLYNNCGGQGHLKGEILRIGHMGQISPFDILQVVSALEIIVSEFRNEAYIGTKNYSIYGGCKSICIKF